MRKMTQVFYGLALVSLPLAAHAQYHSNDETTIGLTVEADFSGYGYNGITPALTIGCSTYQLHFGPRIGFLQMAGSLPENELHYFFDIGYRYSFFHTNGFSLFAAIRAEYDSYRSTQNWYHDFDMLSQNTTEDAFPLGGSDFNAQTVSHHRNFNPYLGVGAEYILVDKLYVTCFAGAGMKTKSGYSEYYNADTGEQLYEQNFLFDAQGFSWMGSVGVGYRL